MNEPEDRAREMLSYFWQTENRVLQNEAAFDMDNVRATIAIMAKHCMLADPLPAAESFADPSYAIEADE
nr:MAG: hypothetical protein E4H34_05365 [Hyphomicrobiales bacterium]